jgi:hypothetical protein
MTPEHDLDLDPELEARARRQLHRLADAIVVEPDADPDMDADVDADVDGTGPTGAEGIAPARSRPRTRFALVAAALLVVVALATAAALVVTGDDRPDDVAAGDSEQTDRTDSSDGLAGGEVPADEPTPTELPTWLAQPWYAPNGGRMPTDGWGPSMVFYQGSDHCGWERVSFVEMSWPPGFVPTSQPLSRQFARDPDGVLRDPLQAVQTRGAFDGDATLPDDARETGLHNDQAQIWVAESDPDAIYVRRSDGTAERWPRVEPLALCA